MAKWGDTAGGALTGATTGGMIGGPVGAGVGAVAGGLLGYFGGGGGQERPEWDPQRSNFDLPGYGGMRDQYGNLLGQGPRQAPQAGQSGFRGSQSQLAGMLMGQARGEGPGQEIARQQAQIATDRGLGQQLAMARSARPGQSAMAARNAAMASGQLQGQGAQAATMGGLQAQQQAVGQLGGVLQGARGQDIQRNLANAQLQYQTMGLDDARQLELLRQQLQMNRAQQQGGQAFEGALGARYGQQYGEWAQQPSDLEKVMGAAQGAGQAYLGYQAGQQRRQPQQGPGYGYANPDLRGGMDRYGPYGTPASGSQYSDQNLAYTFGV